MITFINYICLSIIALSALSLVCMILFSAAEIGLEVMRNWRDR